MVRQNSSEYDWAKLLYEKCMLDRDDADYYAVKLVKHDLSIQDLPDLTQNVLKNVGISRMGHCLAILKYSRVVRDQSSPAKNGRKSKTPENKKAGKRRKKSVSSDSNDYERNSRSKSESRSPIRKNPRRRDSPKKPERHHSNRYNGHNTSHNKPRSRSRDHYKSKSASPKRTSQRHNDKIHKSRSRSPNIKYSSSRTKRYISRSRSPKYWSRSPRYRRDKSRDRMKSRSKSPYRPSYRSPPRKHASKSPARRRNQSRSPPKRNRKSPRPISVDSSKKKTNVAHIDRTAKGKAKLTDEDLLGANIELPSRFRSKVKVEGVLRCNASVNSSPKITRRFKDDPDLSEKLGLDRLALGEDPNNGKEDTEKYVYLNRPKSRKFESHKDGKLKIEVLGGTQRFKKAERPANEVPLAKRVGQKNINSRISDPDDKKQDLFLIDHKDGRFGKSAGLFSIDDSSSSVKVEEKIKNRLEKRSKNSRSRSHSTDRNGINSRLGKRVQDRLSERVGRSPKQSRRSNSETRIKSSKYKNTHSPKRTVSKNNINERLGSGHRDRNHSKDTKNRSRSTGKSDMRTRLG